jgi:hypothetical protein
MDLDTTQPLRPVLVDAKSAKRWLAELPQADVRATQQAFLWMLTDLEHGPAQPLVKLEIMETVRATAHKVQATGAKRYTERPLPLARMDALALDHTVELWSRIASTYASLLAVGGKDALADHLPLVAQRAIRASMNCLVEHWRARVAPPMAAWEEPLRLLELAQALDIDKALVKDSQNPREKATPQSAFVFGLLAQAVARLPVSDFETALELAARWERRADIQPVIDPANKYHRRFYAGGEEIIVDIRDIKKTIEKDWETASAQEQAAKENNKKWEEMADETGKWMEISGTSTQLLKTLRGLWCEGAQAKRNFPRRTADQYQAVEVAVAPGAMVYLLTSHAFSPPVDAEAPAKSSYDYTRRDHEQMAMFQHDGIAKREERDAAAAKTVERWMLVDESATGLHVRTPAARAVAGEQFGRGQMLMVRLTNAPQAMLAKIRWVVEYRENAADGIPFIDVGLELLPFRPLALMVRAAAGSVAAPGVRRAQDAPDPHRQFVPAFELKALGTPSEKYAKLAGALVLPGGWYRKGRVLEAVWSGRESSVSGAATQAALLDVVDDGPGVEIVSWQ